MECIWSKHWKNFLPKPEMFPACKHLFPEALAPSVNMGEDDGEVSVIQPNEDAQVGGAGGEAELEQSVS